MSLTSDKPRQLNFANVVNTVVLGVVIWVGTSIQGLKTEQSKTNERLSVIEATNPWKQEQLNRIENEQGRMRAQVNDIQLEISRIKGGTK